jgi:hypothetical protein
MDKLQRMIKGKIPVRPPVSSSQIGGTIAIRRPSAARLRRQGQPHHQGGKQQEPSQRHACAKGCPAPVDLSRERLPRRPSAWTRGSGNGAHL